MKRAQSGYLVNVGFFRNTQGQLCRTNPGFYFREANAVAENLANNPDEILPKKSYNVVKTPSKL